MAGYRLIRIGDVCNGLATRAKAQQAAGKFDEAKFAETALTEIGKQHADAKSFSEESVTLVETELKTVEKASKDIKTLLGRSRMTDADNKKAMQLVKSIRESFEKVEEDDGALDAALDPQYRKDGWQKALKALLGDKSSELNEMFKEVVKIEDEEKKKQTSIEAIEKIVAECDKSLNKAEKQATKDRAEVLAEVAADLENAEDLMQKQIKGIDDLEKNDKVKAALKTFAELGKKKEWTVKEAEGAQAAMTAIKGAATRMRGAFKTMSTQFDDMLERALENPEAAKKFKDRVIKAEKLVDSTEKRVDEFDKDSEKYAALAKKIDKAAK